MVQGFRLPTFSRKVERLLLHEDVCSRNCDDALEHRFRFQLHFRQDLVDGDVEQTLALHRQGRRLAPLVEPGTRKMVLVSVSHNFLMLPPP